MPQQLHILSGSREHASSVVQPLPASVTDCLAAHPVDRVRLAERAVSHRDEQLAPASREAVDAPFTASPAHAARAAASRAGPTAADLHPRPQAIRGAARQDGVR
jgi:hypothetical protein